QKPEDAEPGFEFPEFDEPGFLRHEFEQFYATIIAFVLGVVVGIAAYVVGRLAVPVAVPFGVGIAGVVVGTLLIRQVRPASSEYTKGDWASLVVLIFFGFLGFWLLFAGLSP
ncbi:MAG TPA: hypothetical protein VMH90_04005, partial [Thermoplasmata archaeon]|nr:hypothetical protein [Thermoplasmata archaeon]